MGMTIDLAIKILKRMMKTGIAYDDGYAFEPLSQDEEKACSIAIDTMNRYQMTQADYENRLKADLKAILVELQTEIEEKAIRKQGIDSGFEYDYEFIQSEEVVEIIQQKINSLKEEKQ